MTLDRLALPVPPASPSPWRFPFVAVVAPVVVSVAIWLVTGSVFALLFAALGPVTAIASLVDQRWNGRRTARRESARFRMDADAAAARILAAHAEERASRDEAVPDGPAVVAAPAPDRGRWRYGGGELLVALGRGLVASELETDVLPRDADETSLVRLRSLVDSARFFEGAVTVDARLGLGVCGPRRAVLSVVRGLVLQCARALPPDAWWVAISGTGAETPWLEGLPHGLREASGSGLGFRVEFGERGSAVPVVVLAAAATEADLPADCRVVLAVASGSPGRIVDHPDRLERREVRPAYVSRLDAESWAQAAREDAAAAGLMPQGAELPSLVAFQPIRSSAVDPSDRSLTCDLGSAVSGAFRVDLVGDGPHAVVGGTTGSGKSELLVSWVLAMAAAHPPERFTVLLVDFKGGSAFAPLTELPHTVGIITDLDRDQAERALASLRAELRYRERELARHGARSIEETDLARLVIVVDEFAAMLAEHPDLHALFGDIAARGRSLGLHLVLCTQRPAAAVRDGVLANADLRLSLRVNNAADSQAVVGVPDAAELPVDARGRAIVRVGSADPVPVQIPLATDDDARAVATRWAGSPPPRRPWCDPLPPRVTGPMVGAVPGIPLGLLDLPEEQRRAGAGWDPPNDGHLLVLGAPRSGRSTALAALGMPPAPADPAGAWDAVASVVALLDASPSDRRTLLVLDDVDALIPRFGAEHRAAWLDLLARILREGAARGIAVALSAQRTTGEFGTIAALAPARLLLRHANKQEWALAGGDSAAAVVSGPPGAGRWRGYRIQVIDAPVQRAAQEITWDALPVGRAIAVATTRAASVAASLARAGWRVIEPAAIGPDGVLPPHTAVVADVDDWQSRWGALAAVRGSSEILLEGCSPADVRALTRSRVLPPPLPPRPDACWRLRPDGSIGRATLPTDSAPI